MRIATIEEHLDRRIALKGADFVINMVQIGMHEATLLDFEIPRKYGLKQTIADTSASAASSAAFGPSPSWWTSSAEMRALCPDALLMNYTNPMSILTQAVYEAFPEQKVVGLCHNVQNTANELACYLNVPATVSPMTARASTT